MKSCIFSDEAKHFDNLVADVRELRKTYLEINREIAAMHYEMRCELDDVNRYCAGIKDRLSRMCGHLGLDVPAGADQAKRQTIWARNGILVRQQQQQHGNAEISKLSPAPASEPTTAPSASAPNVTNSRETANADPTDEEEKDAAVPAESDRTPRDVPRPGRGLTYPMPDAPKFVPLRHRQAANQALKQQTGQATSSVPSHSLPKVVFSPD